MKVEKHLSHRIGKTEILEKKKTQYISGNKNLKHQISLSLERALVITGLQ